ncbi:MAG: HAMP domain-containing histidine kinase, partial [Acidobacteria bacterium]|nr:HAMP domain-containing histidine kinase [Acidobacteriota bacterium]
DTGIGIDPAECEHIFERFYRADGARANTGGLGLSVVRWVVEHHGGSVSILDREGPGAVFEVRLPRRDAASQGVG